MATKSPSAVAGYYASGGAGGALAAEAKPPRRRLGRPRFARLPALPRPNPYAATWRFGYATAAALGLLLVVGLLLGAAGASSVVASVRDRSIDPLAAAVRQGGSLYLLEMVFVVVGAVALAMFSAFVGLTTRNAPLLGAEAAPLLPGAAARAWFNVLWAHARLAVLLVVPPLLFERGLGIPACIGVLVLIEWMQRHVAGLLDWLTNPGRHLVELYDRLGLKGLGSLLVRAWRLVFVAANLLLVALWSVPIAVAATRELSRFRKETQPPADGFEPAQLVLLGVAAAFAIALALTIGLLVPIVAELSERQRIRRTLVIAGLARPWTSQGQAAAAATSRPPSEDDWDDRPALRWSDLGTDREAWEAAADRPAPFETGLPRA